MEFLPAAFDALASVSQFVVYRLSPSKTRAGKTDKLPIDFRTGHAANAHNPDIWLSPALAIATAQGMGPEYGVGFVFTPADPFWFIDIDNCLEPFGTTWSPLALSLLSAFNGAAVEISASGRGLHIIGSGVAPAHGCRNAAYGLEFYTSDRFVALTGTHATGSAAYDGTPMLQWLVDSYFPATRSDSVASSDDWTDEPCEGWNGPADDAELIERALRSAPAAVKFGREGVTFRDLWEANEQVLAQHYPPNDTDVFNRSDADGGLAQRLAFWTGNDCERIRRLMTASALNREKWEREDYLPRTILGVCGRQREWLCDKPPQGTPNINNNQSEPVVAGRPRATDVEGSTFLTIAQQKDVFEGCVYVVDDHRIMIPGGQLLNPERFRALYGGYSFTMDKGNERTSRNAFEAFTESQALRHNRVASSCFRPDQPPGCIVEGIGETSVNIYYPVQTPRQRGDISRFLTHIQKLFPVPSDQAIILAYLAAIVQHKGIKFQWAPLIQGVEGNGKTFLTRCIAYAIGSRYSHFPKAAEIAGKFNGWLYAKIFVGVEDIYLHDNRFEVMETLKPMITNERQEIEAKGAEKLTRDICANFLINTNHKDGLIKTRNDRRFAPFYTAQQAVADLHRDGMMGDYFPDLYYWASKQGGYAMIADFLDNYPIPPELNPAVGCGRAPATSSTEDAIEQGRSNIEVEILEAVAQGIAGFRSGWISSMALDRYLINIQAARKVPMNKRKEFMESMGYVWHPGLSEGRVNNVVLPDNGKPRLYIRTGHRDMHLEGASEIAKAYEAAQKAT